MVHKRVLLIHNRELQFVRTGSRPGGESPGNRGVGGLPGIPLPPVGDNDLQETEREREKLRIPASQTEGCFCNGNGCSGSTCGSLNGCVCNSSGTCWGAACSARVPTTSPVAEQLPQVSAVQSAITQGQIASPQTIITPGVQQVLSSLNSLNPVNLVRNALMAQPAMVNGQQVMQLTPVSGNILTQAPQNNDCTCNQNGCSGNGCASLNGCFCVGQNCWGNACQNSVFSQQMRQPAQQGGNLFDIPDLFGGGGGGGGDVEGQIIPVVQGMPVTRLNGQRARRIRNGVKGRRGMGGMAASGRVRTRTQPPQLLKKRTRIPANAGNDDDQDWAPEPAFKRITVNGTPTFVRFSRRKDSTTAEEQVEYVNTTRNPSARHESEQLPSLQGKTKHKISENEALPDRTFETENPKLNEEESERRESIYREPLLFSEDVVDVKIVSLDK